MASSCRGVMRLAALYMRSRQLQKSSCSLALRSASPAMARWKAWLWPLTRPGKTGPARRSAPRWSCAGAPGTNCVQRPSAPTDMSTSCAQAPLTQAAGAR